MQNMSENSKDLERENRKLKNSIKKLEIENNDLEEEMKRIKSTLSWRITAPLRLVRILPAKAFALLKFAVRIIRFMNISNAKKFFATVRQIGLKNALLTAKYKLRKNNAVKFYKIWMKLNNPTEFELENQKNTKFAFSPKISVVVPMYNTPVGFFAELVEYMIGQTYANWELCLEDGSPEKNEEIADICSKDERIKYNYTGKNLGIAGNTNKAIERATGDYIGLLDHDDLLPVNCLYEIVNAINEDPDVEFIYTDEDKFTTTDKPRFDPHFKPDFAIDTLRSNNYICHFSVFRRDLMEKLGGERSEYDGAQDYDLIIRMAETAKNIKHIPKILYHWRVHDLSTSKLGDAKPYAFEAGIKVIEDHLERVGLKGSVTHGATLGTYKIDYEVEGEPKVSILIPNCNQADTLQICVNSILDLTTYNNYEIVIIENNSTEQSVFDYYDSLSDNSRIKVLRYGEQGFNYSKIINFGVKNTDGEYIVQLNNDTELITPDWLEKMIGMCQREDVGCVGVKLYYPDNTVQHAGVILGMGGIAGHVFKGLDRNVHGYFARDSHIQNLSIVTAACMMSKRSVYEQVGFMEEQLAVAFNDVDFCLKVIESGKLIIYNPFVEFYHYESKSRGNDNTPSKKKRFKNEIEFFHDKWENQLNDGDKYYNKNLRLDDSDYSIRPERIF